MAWRRSFRKSASRKRANGRRKSSISMDSTIRRKWRQAGPSRRNAGQSVPGRDPRVVFADWLISSTNSPFAANAVNRIWYWLMGRGIIQEPDDIRPDNPPSNPELLAWLARELVSANYDVKHIYRLILNSRAYQLSSIPEHSGPARKCLLRVSSAAPHGGGGAHRRAGSDHRLDGGVL